jgi:uncharacterized membrane protein (DUF4010 family)
MTLREALLSLAVALGAGVLIGAERQQAQSASRRADFGGIRTFPLISLAGALGALMVPVVGVWMLVLLLGAVGALLAVSHGRQDDEGPGLSTEIAALVTFALGALSAMPEVLPGPERFLIVAAGAVTVMALLAMKNPLHGFVAKVSTDDVYATVKFAILVAVVLPILPDHTFGPLGVLNPFKVGMMIVLVAGMSFAGYVAVRVVGGQRGLLLTGFLGGLVSSTAVTLTFSGRAKQEPQLATLCALAIAVASATMFARVLAVVALVDRSLLELLAWPMGAMAGAGFAVSIWMWWRETHRASRSEAVPLKNPFELKQAVKFGLVYAIVLFLAKAAEQAFGARGVYASSLVGGIADVDAVTLSLTELHRQGLDARTATTGITLAATMNTIVKGGIATVLGGRALGVRVGTIFLIVLAAGGAALYAVPR